MRSNVCTEGASVLRERVLDHVVSRMTGFLAGGAQDPAAASILRDSCRALHAAGAGIAGGKQGRIEFVYNLPHDAVGRLFREVFPEARMQAPATTAIFGDVASGNPFSPLLTVPVPGRESAFLFYTRFPADESCQEVEIRFAEQTAVLVGMVLREAGLRQELALLKEQADEERAGFNALLEDIPAGVILIDASGALVRGNDQIDRIWRSAVLALTRESGVKFSGVHSDGSPYPPEDWPLARALRSGEVTTAEEIGIRRGDGTDATISVSAGPVRDVGGRIRAAVMVVQDVTERKEAENTRSRLAAQVESAGRTVISLTKDERGIIRSWSRGAEKLYGYRQDEVIGKHVSLLLPPGFPDDIPEILKRIRSGELIENHETLRMKKDGTLVHVSLSISPIRDHTGTVIGAATIAADVTALRRVEEALRESELKFRKIASAAQDAVILIDNRGMVEFWNDAAARMFGFTSEEMSGRFLHDYIMPERYQPEFKQGFEQFTSTGEGKFIGRTYEITARNKDGSEFPVELSLAGMKLKEQWNAIGIVRDITGRKLAEQELKRTLAELERSNTELGQFAYIASHDLQEPLRTVSSFVELLAKRYAGQLDEKADKYISFAVDGARRMSTLIDDLLAYSRVGTQAGRFGPVDMNEVLKTATTNLRTSIEETRARIDGDGLPMVNGDRVQLVQLLQNLIANAIKFRKKDSRPAISVTAERSSGEWIFRVRDNGIGIEPRYHERIFAIFQRLHSQAEYPGTGLGLAVCKRIVERHGGRIGVESQPGMGSTFYFILPADTALGHEAPPEKTSKL